MYNLTGLPGWIRFGFSPGWSGRSPTGLPPTAQWILQSGQLPQYMQHLQRNMPATASTESLGGIPTADVFTPSYSKEQEKQMLEQQIKILKDQLEGITNRLKELDKDTKKMPKGESQKK
jgi:hypothetical protein